jgi:hypothetical protein
MEAGYAQNDEHLRKMEREAYETGNMCFRDWEDSIKSTIYFEHLQKGEKKMLLKDWTNNELTNLLAEAWGFKFNTLQEFEEFDGSGELQKEGEDELEEIAGVGGGAPDPRKRRKPHGTGSRVEDEEEQGEEAEDEKKKQVAESEDTGASKDDESKTHKGEKDYTTKKGEKLKTTGKGRGEKKGDEADVNERTKRDTPDRVAGRDTGGRRLKPLEEEDIEEISGVGGGAPDPRRRRKPHGAGQLVEPHPEEEEEEEDPRDVPRRAPKHVAVAESAISKDQIREVLRQVLVSLNK